jgi:hypothetical protein
VWEFGDVKGNLGKEKKPLCKFGFFFWNKNMLEDLWRLLLYIFMHFLVFP